MIFPLMLLGPDMAALKLRFAELKVGQKTGQVVWLVYHISVLFFFLQKRACLSGTILRFSAYRKSIRTGYGLLLDDSGILAT